VKLRAPKALGRTTNTAEAQQDRERKRKAAIARAVVGAAIAKLVAAKPEQVWQVVEAFVIERSLHDTTLDLLKPRGIQRQKTKKGGWSHLESGGDALERWISEQPKDQQAGARRQVVLELMLYTGAPGSYSTELTREPLTTAVKVLGVNASAIAAKVREDLKAKKAPKRAKAS